MDEMTVQSIADERGMRRTKQCDAAIGAAVAEYDPEAEHNFTVVIANGTPAKHGEHGRFELEPSLAEIHERAKKLKMRRIKGYDSGDVSLDSLDEINHYDRSTLCLVKAGDAIGRIVPSTPGVDGIDVSGQSLAAREGHAASIKVDDETVSNDGSGNLIAKIGGIVLTDDDHVRVSDTLEIHGGVDFSTGHVEFEGDISIRQGVRDCFEVTSGGTACIDGLVEAAVISASDDIELKRGMSAREKGSLHAGRDLKAKFIDSATIVVERDLLIEREMTHCQVTIWRSADSPRATIIGGECVIAGEASFAQLGSESGSPTVIRLGSIARIDSLVSEALELLPHIERRATNARAELEPLQANAVKLNASQAESMTELQFIIMDAEAKATDLKSSIAQSLETSERLTQRSLVVHKRIMPGVVICLGGKRAAIKEEIAGPVRISTDETGEPVVIDLRDGAPSPLARWAAMDIDGFAIDPGDVKQLIGEAA